LIQETSRRKKVFHDDYKNEVENKTLLKQIFPEDK